MNGRFEFQLDKRDWEKYQRGDEWFLFDATILFDATATELAELEKALGGYRIARLLADLDQVGAQALRAACWIARRQAGVRENFPAFDPRILAAEIREPVEPAGDDADPPDSASPEPQPSSTAGQPDTSPPTSDPDSPPPTPDSDPATSAT
jgi:hypothetical protein